MNYTSKNIGNTRRVWYRPGGFALRNIFVCLFSLFILSFFGSTQAQTIGVPTVTGAPVCAGSAITVQFVVTNGTGTANHFNNSSAPTPTTYTAYLSNGSGSFASPTLIVFTNNTAPLPLDG